MRKVTVKVLVYFCALQALPAPAVACSVCFGDPNSSMARGALMGVYVLAGVVFSVLTVMAATALFWVQRGRRVAREEGWNDERADS